MRQRLLQNGGAVDEGAMAELADVRPQALGQALQALAHHLVIVAAERITRDVTLVGLAQYGPGGGGIVGPVVERDGDDPDRTGHELVRVGATAAVARHPVHGAVAALGQPLLELGLDRAQIDIGDPERAEAQLARPSAQRGRKVVPINTVDWRRITHRYDRIAAAPTGPR